MIADILDLIYVYVLYSFYFECHLLASLLFNRYNQSNIFVELRFNIVTRLVCDVVSRYSIV